MSLNQSVFASPPYEQDDWVTYKDARYVYGGDKDRAFIYFATLGGIARINLYTQQWVEPLTVALIPGEQIPFDTTYVVAVEELKQNLWCGTAQGLLVCSALSETWESYNLPTGNAPVLSIGFLNDTVWLEVGYMGQGWRSLMKGNNNFGDFVLSNPSELALAGAVKWRGERKELQTEFPQYFPNNGNLTFWPSGKITDSYFKNYAVTDVIGDEMRRITYITFWGYGVGIVDDNSQRMDIMRQGPAWNKVKLVYKDGQNFYTVGSALSKWNREQNKWTYFLNFETSGLESDVCYDVFKQGQSLYIATELGMAVFNEISGGFHTLNSLNYLWDSQVLALDGDSDELWIGTAQGINSMRYFGETIERIKDESVRGRFINDIKIDNGFIWAAADYGIYLHDRKVGDWTYVAGSPEMHNSQANQICVDKQKVWFARDDGIDCYNKSTGKFNAYQSIFFGGFHALSVFANDSLVWVGTDGGLYKLDLSQNRWAAFTTEDGLPSNTVNSILQEGDYLWLGTDNGLCRFFWNDPYRMD